MAVVLKQESPIVESTNLFSLLASDQSSDDDRVQSTRSSLSTGVAADDGTTILYLYGSDNVCFKLWCTHLYCSFPIVTQRTVAENQILLKRARG